MKTIRSFTKNPLTIVVLLIAFLNLSCNQDDFAETQIQSSSEDLYAKSNNDYSGEELFQGLFFAYGDFASTIDLQKNNVISVANLSDKQMKSYKEQMDLVIKTIYQNHPRFFNEFKTEILSKDHWRVEQALIKGGEVFYESLKTIYPRIEKVTEALQADIENGKILTEGEIDKEKLEKQFIEYQKLLTENSITPTSPNPEIGEEGCSVVLVCAAAVVLAGYFAVAVHNTAAVTAVAAVVWAVTVTKKETQPIGRGYNGEDLLAFEMLVGDLANL